MSDQPQSDKRTGFADKRLEAACIRHQKAYQDLLDRAVEVREEFRQNAASIDCGSLAPADQRTVALLKIFGEFEANLQSMKGLPSSAEMAFASTMGVVYGSWSFGSELKDIFQAFGADMLSTASKIVGRFVHFRSPSKIKMNRMKWLCRDLDDTAHEFTKLRKIEKLVPALPESARDKALAREFRALGLHVIARVIDSLPPAP